LKGIEMAKRTTNAETILSEARIRVAGAQSAVGLAERSLEVANAALAAHSEALNALEKALVSKPRKKSVASQPALKEPADKAVSDAQCVGMVPTLNVPCTYPESNLIHDPKGGYASYHPFEAGKSVARAPRKSKQKSEAASSDQNSETQAEGVSDAVLAAGGGD
jgi:hypothetical protein